MFNLVQFIRHFFLYKLYMEEKMKHELYCKNGEWNYTARFVNFGNFTIQYITKGGFKANM